MKWLILQCFIWVLAVYQSITLGVSVYKELKTVLIVSWFVSSHSCIYIFLQFDEILADLEEQRELATNRLAELEKLSKEHQATLKEIEQLKLDVSHLYNP